MIFCSDFHIISALPSKMRPAPRRKACRRRRRPSPPGCSSVTWPSVWPGVSSTLISKLPNGTMSPSATSRSIPGMRSASPLGPMMVQPVSSLSCRLPPVWSPWWCVTRRCVSFQPFGLEAGQDRLGVGRIDRGRDARIGVVDQHRRSCRKGRQTARFRASACVSGSGSRDRWRRASVAARTPMTTRLALRRLEMPREAVRLAGDETGSLSDAARCRRSARVLRDAARADGAAPADASHPRALAGAASLDADRARSFLALPRRLPRRGAAPGRADAGQPGRGALAARWALANASRGRRPLAAGRRLRRPAACCALPRGRRQHAATACAKCGACWRPRAA